MLTNVCFIVYVAAQSGHGPRTSWFGARHNQCNVLVSGPPLWCSCQEFLATDPEARVRFPALLEKSSGSGTESTQPHDYNRGAT
jgi:hypothetical protein